MIKTHYDSKACYLLKMSKLISHYYIAGKILLGCYLLHWKIYVHAKIQGTQHIEVNKENM